VYEIQVKPEEGGMNGPQLQSVAMTPKKTITIDVWECRYCHAIKPVKGKPPVRCWNYKCRRMDWDRDKIKEGRPRKDGKGKPGRPKSKKRGK